MGAVDYLLKPIDDNQLINKISTYFRLIEKERDLNRQLEVQVAARTAELHTANRYPEQHRGPFYYPGRNPGTYSVLAYRHE